MSSAVEAEPSPQDTPGGDRVRENTDADRQAIIDRELRERVDRYRTATAAQLDRRIQEVELESDIERVLEINASVLALAGVLAGAFWRRRFLAVSAVVLGFLLQHGLQGWCPPVPLFRRLGVRTRQEIDAERYALKALRGDLDEFCRPTGELMP